MKDILYKSDDCDFNKALSLIDMSFSEEQLAEMLLSDNDVEKQIAVLSVENLSSFDISEKLVKNLVGQDGKIREAVAFKINEFSSDLESVKYLKSEYIYNILFEGLMDIDGNVCRNIVTMQNMDEFWQYIPEKLIQRTNETILKIKELDAEHRQYVISKRNFQLYWCLEALWNVLEYIDIEKCEEIFRVCAEFEDYTIREKVAKLLSKLNDDKFSDIVEKLSNDENFYVRQNIKI